MIRGEGCVHIVASGFDACDMLGTMAVRWMHAMFVTGRDAVLRSDRAAAWGLNSPQVRDNQCDSDVPLELLPVDALMYEDAIFWRNLPGILGFIPSFFAHCVTVGVTRWARWRTLSTCCVSRVYS